MFIVTLTTIPSRFDQLGPTLDSLLGQSDKPDRIIVYVPQNYTRFPDYDGALPDLPEGVEVHRADKDYGPATKVLPAVKEFRGVDCNILFCDDDQIYPRDWVARFKRSRKQRPNECIVSWGTHLWQEHVPLPTEPRPLPRALRLWRKTDPFYNARKLRNRIVLRLTGKAQAKATRRSFLRSGYIDLIGGSGGVLVRPEFLDDVAAFDIPDNQRLVDDMWLSGLLEKNGVSIWVDASHRLILGTRAAEVDALKNIAKPGDDRTSANQRCIAYLREIFGIWR